MTVGNLIFDTQFLKKLELLTLVSKKIRSGKSKGERKSVKRGHSLEFMDFRNYTRGDDLRYLDWNIYGRLEKLFVKLYAEEEDLHIHILLDNSKSMNFGNPTKLDYGKRIAAALSYIGLSNYDAVGLGTFSGTLGTSFPPVRNKAHIFQMLDYLSGIEVGGDTRFNGCIQDYVSRQTKSGTAIIISDFLDPIGYEDGLKYLLSRRYELFVLQVLSPEELNPVIRGDLKLIDCESGNIREITINERVLKRYKDTLSGYCSQLQSFCRKRGIYYYCVSTNISFEDLILKYLTGTGFIT